ncbi:MAG: 50S ribosomal protein L23 [Candidatus Levybacteria bacterium]|nr:50S ribosomal protein L23 [Candidatus Levybacteria bacterium]
MKNVLIGPIITERSMASVKNGKFSFNVALHANKESIRKAINLQFGVDVVGIETVTQKGRSKRVGARRAVKTLASLKKAIVTLKTGQKIDIFDLGV